jgi:hypothetical protein
VAHDSLLKRALNRAGRRFGVLPFPPTFEGGLEGAGDRSQVFEEIYAKNFWGSPQSRSGPGSEVARTERYRSALVELLRRRNIRSMFDAPCGDLNWMKLVLEELPIAYSGGDISDYALEEARKNCPGVDVRRFDICSDAFPSAELWHCRDSLFHLSFPDIWLALENASRSNLSYALITTNRSIYLKNLDIETGGSRYLDLERPPFRLPRALEYLFDGEPGEFPRYVGLWTMDSVRECVSRRQ